MYNVYRTDFNINFKYLLTKFKFNPLPTGEINAHSITKHENGTIEIIHSH